MNMGWKTGIRFSSFTSITGPPMQWVPGKPLGDKVIEL